MKVKSLKIEKFRHLENIEIKFGRLITAIAGQNGTGKSSILGLVGHLFTFRDKENGNIHKTINGKFFETEFSEIFRFSSQNDKASKHKYTAELDNSATSFDHKTLSAHCGQKLKKYGRLYEWTI